MIDPLGDRAVRFPRPAGSARALVQTIKQWPGVIDVVVARDAIGVYFDREPVVDAAQIAALAALPADEAAARDIVLQAIYDGPDLAEVGRTTGVDVVAQHAAATYTVETMGFAPGFAYLTGLDPALHVPRRTTPRTRVPAGSLAIAGGYTAVYPFDSPGGWHLIGRVATPMFGPNGPLLALGDRVRFVPC